MKIFTKIFISFWIAQALFFVLAVLVTWVIRQQGEAGIEAAQSRILNDAVLAYEHGGEDSLHKYFESLRESQHIRGVLLNDQGFDVNGRQTPDWIRRGDRQPPGVSGDFWGAIPRFTVNRQSMTSASGHRYTLVTIEPPSGPFGPRAMTWRGILIGIISSGLVCYLLAGYLTAPVVRLRSATQKLAAGDLSARAGGSTSRQGDEIVQLVRDFDTMAERLEKLVKAQARLLNDISHELRSPLARINVALALARQRSGPEAEAFLDRMDLESNRLNELVERLLTIARLDASVDGTHKRSVDLADLITEIAEDADFEAQGLGCHVVAVIQGACKVNGNPALLHSAIENVVRNAVRYTAKGSDVEVRLEQADREFQPEAVVRVSDFGPGVPEDSLEKIFLPFYRIDDARGRQTGGAGLGLAITERAVELHGGTVRASNRKEGGLTVEIRLPLADPHALAAAKPPEAFNLAGR
ncbi:MAG TPA: ATP-binding protein [Terriglobales bacterium]|jgi:two-component system sensor histidine kinase CpxA